MYNCIYVISDAIYGQKDVFILNLFN